MVLSSMSSGMGFPTVTWKMYSANSITGFDLPLRPTEVVDFTFAMDIKIVTRCKSAES